MIGWLDDVPDKKHGFYWCLVQTVEQSTTRAKGYAASLIADIAKRGSGVG